MKWKKNETEKSNISAVDVIWKRWWVIIRELVLTNKKSSVVIFIIRNK